jgi:hypothetical protein
MLHKQEKSTLSLEASSENVVTGLLKRPTSHFSPHKGQCLGEMKTRE